MVFSTASKQFQIEVEGSAEAYYGIGNRIHRHRSQKMINRDLTGYIVHHLLTPINATPEGSLSSARSVRKHQRLDHQDSHVNFNVPNYDNAKRNDTPKAGNKRRRSESPLSRSRIDEIPKSSFKDGFYFIPEADGPRTKSHAKDRVDESVSHYEEYRLIAAQSVIQFVIDAARFHYPVTIKAKAYSIMKNTRSACNQQMNAHIHIMELCHDGIIVHGERQPQADPDTYLSLKQFQAEEIQMEMDRKKKDKNSNKNEKKHHTLYNIEGTIDAISPILGVSSNDPFSLVELYDQENDPSLTASVVIKGPNALACQPGMHPGSIIKFMNVKRQRWHVPQSFQSKGGDNGVPNYLSNRAPSHVFVVSDPKCIQWNEEYSFEKNDGHSEHEHEHVNEYERFLSVPFPTTVLPLTSLQGRVITVKYTSERNVGRIIHYMFIMPPGKGALPIKLYLTYFPLSSSLSLGLRKGSFIRAINVHGVNSHVLSGMRIEPSMSSDNGRSNSYHCFGACVRSTVSILATASEFEFSFDDIDGDTNNKTQQYPDTTGVVSHVFKQRKQSYFEVEWMSLCRKLFSNSCKDTDDLTIERTLKKLIAEGRNDNKDGQRRRDPYKEWFDHACEATFEEDEGNELDTCTCEAYMNSSIRTALPYVSSLENLRQICMQEIDSALSDQCNSLDEELNHSDRVGVGCTASVHLTTTKLTKIIGIGARTDLYIGGIVRSTNSDGQIIKLGSSSCGFTLSPYLIENDRRTLSNKSCFLYDRSMFVLVKIRSAVVSCIYLGRYGPLGSNGNQAHDHINLPPMDLDRAFGGSSTIVSIGCHYFAVSIQIQYFVGDVISLARKHTTTVPKMVSSTKDSTVPQGNVRGRLSRQRWKIRKETRDYIGCHIAVSYSTSSIPIDNIPRHMPQTIDIKLRIPSNLDLYDKHDKFQRLKNIPRRVLALTSAWQYVAESCFAPLISGGWNELQDCSQHELELDEVQISFPLHCDHSQPIDIEKFSFAFSKLRHSHETLRYFSTQGKSNFDYYGGMKFYKGMLDNRLCRSIILGRGSNKNYCEAIIPPHLIIGSPADVSISTFHCMRSSVAQDSTRLCKIKNAHVSKVRFCRARAECSRCYKALIRSTRTNVKQTFWDRPFPIGSLLNNVQKSKKTASISKGSRKTNLVCPSGCDRRHAYIKWESSGVLKDNTGTAKLYTERETTILILGKDINIDVIEEGAWNCSNGITYQAGVPLHMDLRLELDRVKADNANKKGGRDLKPETDLSKEFRACYEMHCHCTLSDHLHRQMDFLCQHKPPKKNSRLVKPIEISLISTFGDQQGVIKSNDSSMMTPLLEFSLIDCFRSYDEPQNIGWSMINALVA